MPGQGETMMKRRHEEIQVDIDRVKARMMDATRRLQGREYVHWKQVTAKRRLLKDLNEQLRALEELVDER